MSQTLTDYYANLAAEWLHYDCAVRTSPTTLDVLDFDGAIVGEMFELAPYEGQANDD